MKTLSDSWRYLLPAIVSAVFILTPVGPGYAQDPLEDPEFDPEIHIQAFQTSYLNNEIMPQNDSNSGAATYAVDITVPPGRGGVQPDLELSYNSARKNGWVGMGWSLDLGAIQRSTKWGLDYGAEAFALNGSIELLPRNSWGGGYYEPHIEEAFAKYQFISATGGWVARARDGTRLFYGTTADSRQENPNGVFKWCLDRVEDANGNAMTVTYSTDQGQIYPARIDYTDGVHYVVFTLEDRPDVFTQHNTRSTVTTAKRLKRIDTYGNGLLARSYVLEYEQGYYSGRSRLKQIRRNLLPPIVFFYQEGGYGTFGAAAETETGVMAAEDLCVYLADVNGDGRADLIKRGMYSGTFNKYLGQSDGTFSSAFSSETGVMASEMGIIYFADIDGDGRSDLIIRNTNNLFHVHRSVGDGTFGEAVETDLPVMGGEMGDIYFHNVNGDNRADLIIRNSYGIFHTHFGNTDGTFGGANSTDTGVMLWELGLIYFTDVNGDGITDLIKRNHGGTINTYPSLGDGTFGQPSSSETGLRAAESGYIDFVDVNGDGLADLIRHDLMGNYFAHMSKGDGTFGEERFTVTGQMTLEKNQVYFADINGDGLADLFKRNQAGTVHIHPADGDAADLLSYVGLAVDQDPDNNGYVSLAALTYRPSSEYQNHLLPFIVQTLASSSTTVSTNTLPEGGGQVTSTYAHEYAGGYYDAQEREFRGFEQTVQTNPDGTLVTRQFHQDDYLKGKEARAELKDPEGKALINTTFTWDKEFLDSPEDTIAFVYLDRRHTDFYNTPTVYRRTDFTYAIEHGGLLAAVSSGTDAETVTTENQYDNYGGWLWRRTREAVIGNLSGKVRETYFGYETGTGNLVSTENWLDGGTNPIVTMTYDGYGNPITLTDARGNTTFSEYDAVAHTYLSRVTSPSTGGASHVVAYPAYDYRWGKVKATQDENGNFTYFTYDDLGRLAIVDYPDGGRVEKEYADDVNPRRIVTRVKENDSFSVPTYTYYDGLYHRITTITVGEVVDGGYRYIQSDRYYDEMGRNFFTFDPFFHDDNIDIPWEQTVFDYLGRPVRIERPDLEYGMLETRLSYSGFDVTTTDPDGARKSEVKDYLGRIIAVIEHADEGDFTTAYAYNAAGDLQSVTDHYGHQTLMDYDTLGRKIEMDDPNMGIWTYTYDANGNLKTRTDYKSQIITFDYDELNRLTSKVYSTTDPAVTYRYDNLSVPNGRGRLYSVSNTLVTDTIREYDAMGRRIIAGRSITGAPDEYITKYGYDLAGKLKRITYPDAYEVHYFYFPASGLLAYVAGYDGIAYAGFSDYTVLGRAGRIEYAGYQYDNFKTVDQYTYNRISQRLEKITTRDAAAGEYFQSLEYKYTPAGDIKEKKDNVRGNTYTYLYDKLHRLTAEYASGYFPPPVNTTLDYTYDDAYQPHAVKNIALNGAGFDYSYDDNGNMLGGPDLTNPGQVAARTIVYNADNMPVSIVHGGAITTEFVYDGEGARAKKSVPGGSTTYYIGGHYEVKNGEGVKYIFAGDRRIARRTAGNLYALHYYHKDHLGSTTVITDRLGGKLEASDYLPFGHQREHAGTSVANYLYTDQELDASTGLYNYDPGFMIR